MKFDYTTYYTIQLFLFLQSKAILEGEHGAHVIHIHLSSDGTEFVSGDAEGVIVVRSTKHHPVLKKVFKECH